MTLVKLEPVTAPSRVKLCTTEPLRFPDSAVTTRRTGPAEFPRGVHSIQSIKTCSRSRSYNIFLCSTQLSMEFILFINVKKCWHLNSIFKIGEFSHVNKKTFTFKLTTGSTVQCRGQIFPNFKSQCENLCPVLYGDVSVMVHNCADKILVQENIAPVDGYVQLVHIFKRRLVIIYMSKLKNSQEKKYV